MAKQKHRSENIQAWIEGIHAKPNQSQILAAFIGRGVATQTQIERKTRLTTKQVRSVLEELVTGKPGFCPLINCVSGKFVRPTGTTTVIVFVKRRRDCSRSRTLARQKSNSSTINK